MAQTKAGAIKCAATKIGVTVQVYMSHIERGEKWCTACKSWHPRIAFQSDTSRFDGLSPICSFIRNTTAKAKYTPTPRKRGRRFVKARDGDKEQARGRVNHLVKVGLLSDPNSLACAACGHKGSDRRHEYHHHKGYAAVNHESVISLCSECHGQADKVSARAKRRGRNNNGTFKRKGGS